MSVRNLIALLGLDTVCLPYETAAKVTGTIIKKRGKSIELNFARVSVQIECFIMLTISYLHYYLMHILAGEIYRKMC